MKVKDVMLQRGEKDDDCLTRPLFDVNMRLLESSADYRSTVYGLVHYLFHLMGVREFDDYSELKGISAANVGIPFNIIAVRTGRREDLDGIVIMVNPRIISSSRDTVEVKSNCGSLNLPKPIKVKRREWISVSYYDPHRKKIMDERFSIDEGAATIQHEIDHNRGVLITDTDKHI